MRYKLYFPGGNYGAFVHRWEQIIPTQINKIITTEKGQNVILVGSLLDIYEIALAEASWVIDKPTEIITAPTKIEEI